MTGRVLMTMVGLGLVLTLPAARGLAQPFPQGQCSGLLCSTIGGSTAPPRVGPPPNCGGMLCGSIGDPFYPPGTAPQVAAAPQPPTAVQPATSKPVKSRKNRKRKPVARTAGE